MYAIRSYYGIVDLRSTSIMGFVDALKKLPFFFDLKDQMVELAEKADKVLLIDSSGFNLPLAKAIRITSYNVCYTKLLRYWR